MHPIMAWTLGAAYIGYKYGYKCGMLPTPKRFLALTAFVSVGSLVSAANTTVGALFVYGSLLGLYLHEQSNPSKDECDKLNTNGNSSNSGNSGSTPAPKPAPAPAKPNPSGMPQPQPGPL